MIRSIKVILKALLSVVLFLLFSQLVDAQIGFPEKPLKFVSSRQARPIKVEWDESAFNTGAKFQESLPLAGITSKVEVNILSSGQWMIDQKRNLKAWQLEILPSGMDEMNLYFSVFDPGSLGKLFVLSAEGELLAGAFTHQSQAQAGPFAIGTLPAVPVLLQFQTALDANDYSLIISEIGMMKSSQSGLGFGTSGQCEVNVNCSEGANWQKQKRGVARIIVKQGTTLYYCSGSLVNNAREDRTPFFLTANHCGAQASVDDYTQWLFLFNYEAADCAKPLTEPSKQQSMTGAQLVAKTTGSVDGSSDFKLLRLLQNVPEAYQPYFNGWSRAALPAASGVGIHHPDGDIKKISTFSSPLTSSDYAMGGTSPNGRYWRLKWAATENGFGVTEGGSSGSPLFNADGLIVGALTGGTTSCDDTDGVDFYGKFSYSWASNGSDDAAKLAPWLDPNQSNVEAIGGLDSDLFSVQSDFAAKRQEISINQFVEFDNLSSGTINTFEWIFQGGKPETSNKEKPDPVQYTHYGNFDVNLVVANDHRTDTLVKKDYIRVKPFLYPNPASKEFTLSFGVDISNEIELEVYDTFGRMVISNHDDDKYKNVFESKGTHLNVKLPDEMLNGNYIIVIRDVKIEKTLKFSLIR